MAVELIRDSNFQDWANSSQLNQWTPSAVPIERVSSSAEGYSCLIEGFNTYKYSGNIFQNNTVIAGNALILIYNFDILVSENNPFDSYGRFQVKVTNGGSTLYLTNDFLWSASENYVDILQEGIEDNPTLYGREQGSVSIPALPVSGTLTVTAYKADDVDSDDHGQSNEIEGIVWHELRIYEPVVCDLSINIPLIINNETESGLGDVTVSGVSSNEPIEFSLDQITWSTPVNSNITVLFSSLSAGEYIMYSRDALGCTESVSFTIGFDDVRNEHWRIEFNSLLGINWKVKILEKGYTGSLIEKNGINPTLNFLFESANDDLFKVLKGLSCDISMKSDSDFEFLDVFTSDDRKYLIEIDRNDSLYFKGYSIPELYEEAYIATPYPSIIKARDGLGELKSNKFLDSNGNRISGIKSIFELIKICLDSLELDLNINEAVNLFEVNMLTNDSPFNQAFFDPANFYESETINPSMDEVIEKILEPFGARILQNNGEWWIIRIKEFKDLFTYRKYDSDLNFISTAQFDTLKESNYTTNKLSWVEFLAESGTLLMQSGWRTATINQDFGLKETSLPNGLMTEYDSLEISNPPGSRISTFTQYTLKNWEVEPGDGTIDIVSNGQKKPPLFLIGSNQDKNDHAYLKNSTPIQAAAQNIRLTLNITTGEKTDENEASVFWVRFVNIGASTKYYNFISGTWVTNPLAVGNNFSITEPSSGDHTIQIIIPRGSTVGIPEDGVLEIQVTTPNWLSSFELNSAKFLIEPADPRSGFPTDNEIITIVNENNRLIPDDVETELGDLPDVDNAPAIYENGLFLADGTPTLLWDYESGQTQLLNILGLTYREFKENPTKALNIGVYSVLVGNINTLKDTAISETIYLFNGGSLDAINDVLSAEWLEISGEGASSEKRLLIDEINFLKIDIENFLLIE